MPPDGSGPSGASPVTLSHNERPSQSIDDPSASQNSAKNSSKKRTNEIDESKLDPRLLDVNSDYFPPLEIVWRNVWLFVYLHAAALVGLYLFFTGQVQWKTLIWSMMQK
jgi:hypothetical protein